MQIKKPSLDTLIRKNAMHEFSKHGFLGANMRIIGKKSKVSPSNLYKYFQNKDVLFQSILQPICEDFKKAEQHFRDYASVKANFDTLQEEEAMMKKGLLYINERRLELDLLLNKSFGSSLQNFTEGIVAGYAENCVRFVSVQVERHKTTNGETPSLFFFKNVGRFFLRTLSELLKEKIDAAEMGLLAMEALRYNHYGFHGMLGNPKDKT